MKRLSRSDVVNFARNRGTWLLPVTLILVLSVVFPCIYLSATSNPQGNLRTFPIGVVLEPQTVEAENSPGAAVVAGIYSAVDSSKIHLQTMSMAEMSNLMKIDRLAGAIVIPSTFNRDLEAVVVGGAAKLSVPQISILTNAGDGGINSGLVTGNLGPVLAGVRAELGKRLVDGRARVGAPASGAEVVVLSAPFTFSARPYKALPADAGFGTSAFYFTLVLILIAFIGGSVVNPTVDAALGFQPSEFGPLVSRRPYLHMTRTQTFLVKLGIMTLLAPIAAGVVELVSIEIVGIPVSAPLTLWVFGSAAVAAVSVGVLAIFAVFGGGIGSLVNTVFFIALSMTSSGGTVPLWAVPPFFQWISNFAPFHGLLEGVRAVFYFDSNAQAGLVDGWTHIGVGVGAALLLGLVATNLYARHSRFLRHPKLHEDFRTEPASTDRSVVAS